jgi:phosphoribosyl 1,2-cyclic phosphate phosphodiesterase
MMGLKIEFLGTGGAMTIPRPLCRCRVCEEARKKGVPYSRTGPGVFVHGPNVLIDTSEDIYLQLNRSAIAKIDAVFYSHWHPDHVMGRRILESLNADWRNYPPNHQQTDVYLPEQVAADFQERLGSGEHLQFFASQGYIQLHHLKDGDRVTINGTEIFPFRLAEDYVYAFLFTEQDKRVLIAPDELNDWNPPPSLKGIDLAILPIGLFEYHPFTGERLLSAEDPVLNTECTFAETIEIIKALSPKKTILTHIEEMNQLGYDDLRVLEKRLKKDGLNIDIAYDTLIVDV